MATVITKLPVIRPGALIAANVGAAGVAISGVALLGLFLAAMSPVDPDQPVIQSFQLKKEPKLQKSVQDQNNIAIAGQAFIVIFALFVVELILAVFCINVPNKTIQLPVSA